MYIQYDIVNGHEYARLRHSVRSGESVGHGKSQTLGRVLDKQRLIFKSSIVNFQRFSTLDARKLAQNLGPVGCITNRLLIS